MNWRKSTYSGGGNDCVEIADVRGGRLIRDSKNPHAGHLALPEAEWKALMADAARGTLDLPRTP
ncbi:DUF397 domain-containing protein [Prauserella marina]|uniref:DUF397 domain-containing protein n=1 Tax=Prauserella marina TaxID=530584 RepID=UPI003B84B44B